MIPNRTYTPVRCLPVPHLRDTGGLLRQVPLRYMGYAEIPMRDADGFMRTHTPIVTEPGSLTVCRRAGSLTVVGIPNSSLLIPNWTRHPDHLGSASWVTDADGKAVQHLHYLPWGENFVDQRSTTWNAMYTFSAKEKDSETGYSYFGSRYYNSDLSIWLSVDPMADKYPSLSPYVYCANNPVKLVDPNGEDWYENENGQILWDDNVTKDSKLSPGCTYIGAEDNDIVNHYGFQSHQTQTTTTYGMICMGEEGYHWTKATTKTDQYVKAEVSNDGSGKVFKGISISASTLTSSPGSTEGPMELRGGLEVKYCGKTFKDGLKEDNMPHYLASGTEYKQASINISAAQLIKSRSYIQPIQSISVKGGYSVTGFDQQYRPLVLHGLLPYPRRLKQNF